MDNKLENGDSLYFTKGGRVVKSGGGIYPDIVLENYKKSRFVNSLWRDQLFIKFATHYLESNNIDTIPIVNKKVIKKFKNFVIKNQLKYQLEAEDKNGVGNDFYNVSLHLCINLISIRNRRLNRQEEMTSKIIFYIFHLSNIN